MGHLDEAAFAACLAPCSACGATRHELRSYIDQRVPVMLAEAAGAPRWVHDGEKFIDGTYRIACASCGRESFSADDCPRCHAPGGLAVAMRSVSRLAVPRTCPRCRANELTVVALVPAMTLHAGGPARPKAIADLGDEGAHVVTIECEDCGEIGAAPTRCPLCDAPGPLRPRP